MVRSFDERKRLHPGPSAFKPFVTAQFACHAKRELWYTTIIYKLAASLRMTDEEIIRILIAEDSKVVYALLEAIFENEPDMQVIGRAENGQQAVRMAHELKPDLITMDVRMPVMDGFEATRLIMSTRPAPIVIVSASIEDRDLRITFRAIEEGALAVVEKPHGPRHPDFESTRRQLVNTVRAMAEVKVVRRYFKRPSLAKVDIFESAIQQVAGAYQLVAIGCSTGGPQALQNILSAIPIGFPIPLAIVQHISPGFIGGMVQWLRGSVLLNVKLAEDGERLLPGTAYVAPDDRHLVVHRGHGGLVARLSDDPPSGGHRPSATVLLKSVARVCGARAVGGVLTGMGKDGADGLLAIKEARGHTFIQDEKSAIIFGMPGAALAIGAVDRVVQLNQIAAYLTSLARR